MRMHRPKLTATIGFVTALHSMGAHGLAIVIWLPTKPWTIHAIWHFVQKFIFKYYMIIIAKLP